MKTEWDYTNLADAYLKRPGYSEEAVHRMLEKTGVRPGDRVCDVGAGAAHLTLLLARYGLKVNAVEPNDAMRKNGMMRTAEYEDVLWSEGVGEHTGMDGGAFKLVTFGSSFNVCDRGEALEETYRILEDGGWFACMWNHRDLEDPLQKEIEDILKAEIENYSYGTRREDQTEVIGKSGLFEEAEYLEGKVVHTISAEDFVEGWKSHGTVYRQSADKFDRIIGRIRETVEKYEGGGTKETKPLLVPYTTRIWIARAALPHTV